MNNKPIMALTIWQPYASLIALQEKQFETRGWAAPARLIGSQIVIHAAKATASLYMCATPHFREVLSKRGISEEQPLPLGVALCVATLVKCHHTEDLDNLSMKERAFGDFGPKRFAWEFTNVQLFDRPFPCVGQQGIWQWRGFLPSMAKAQVAP